MNQTTTTTPIKLRPYQTDAVSFLTSKQRAILGDDVGVGKTFPAIEAACQIIEAAPVNDKYVLVIVPPHLMLQWHDAIKQYSPTATVHLVYRQSKPTKELGPGFHIMAYQTIQNSGRKAYPSPFSLQWQVVICDEAHRLRNRKSQQFKNAKQLASKYFFALTGTPVENNAADLWGLLNIIDPQLFRSYWRFVDDWMITVKNPWQTVIIGVRPQLLDYWERTLNKYMLRRTRSEVLTLNDVVHIDMPVEMPQSIMKAHRIARKEYRISHHGLDEDIIAESGGALVQKLRQFISDPPITINPKLETLRQTLNDLPGDDQVVVFAWFRNTARMIARELTKDGYTVFHVDGEMSPDERYQVAEEWKRTPGAIFVGTIPSISEGLNLQNAHIAIFYEENYLPGAMTQAIGRLHRSGQEDVVVVYHIFAKGTVDEAVIRVASRRQHHNEKAVLDVMNEMEE